MAIGRAAVERGAFSKCITYDIVPVDEDGDEIEGDVVIDTPVALMTSSQHIVIRSYFNRTFTSCIGYRYTEIGSATISYIEYIRENSTC